MAATLRSTSSSVVAQDETLILIAALPCQKEPPHQQVPSRWTAWMTALGAIVVPERDQYLVELHLVQNLESGGFQAGGELPRVAAASLDQIHESLSAEGEERRPDVDAAGAP